MNKDASDLLKMSPRKQQHTMSALACLSKYHGCYDTLKEIKERYQLKWLKGESLQVFENIVNGEQNVQTMIGWVKEACLKLPQPFSNVLIFDCLTGLRADEVCKRLELIHNDLGKYINNRTLILEHYRFADVFIRRTKTISIVSDSILDLAKESEPCSYNMLHNALRRRGLKTHVGYCRKIFSTYLRMNGVEAELIDPLQGGIPKTVFARHYFRPDFNKETERIRKLLTKLYEEITE